MLRLKHALLSAAFFIAGGAARAFADPVALLPHQMPNPAMNNVQVNLKPGSIDDQLIEMARAANMNFIVEANEMTAAESKVSGEAQDRFNILLAYYLKENRLAVTHLETNQGYNDLSTLLFWPGFDTVNVARRIAAGESVNRIVALKEEGDFIKELGAHLVEVHRWDINRPQFQTEFKIASLPPALRHEMTARVQARLLQNSSQGGIWLLPDAWAKATARLRRPKSPRARLEISISPGGNSGGYAYPVPNE